MKSHRKEFIVYTPPLPADTLNARGKTKVRPFLFVIAFTAAAWATDHPDLNGTWQLSSTGEGKLKFETLLIQQNEDGVKITESGKEKPVDFSCAVDGHECKLDDGAISFWYNGSALVMMESHHNRDIVTKTRLVPAGDGKTLSLEITRVLPAGRNATYTFKKQP